MRKLLIILCLVVTPARCRAAEYEAVDLGTLGEGRKVMESSHAFLWTVQEGMVDLGTLGGDASRANAINDAGQVVGWARTNEGERCSFTWTPENRMARSHGREARAISNAGWVIGEDHGHPFLWTAEDGPTCLAPFIGLCSAARAMNNSGRVVGFAFNVANQRRAFLWERATGMIDLGTLGGAYSHALAINDSGHVAGGAHTAAGDYHAFVWEDVNGNGQSDPGEMTDLGTLGGTESWACGINDAGHVVGWAHVATGERHAFLWTPEEGMIDLGTLGGTESWAWDINDAGQVVGWARTATVCSVAFSPDGRTLASADQDSTARLWDATTGRQLNVFPEDSTATGEKHAFLWTSEQGMADLGTLGGSQSAAYAISDAGQVVGEACTAPVENHELRLAPEEGMTDAGTGRGNYSRAWAINNAGQVAGCARTATGERRAFVWTPEEGMVDLGTLGGPCSEARALNKGGQIVGEAQTDGGNWHAFLWNRADGMLDLETLAVEGLAVTHSQAYAIDDAGRVVGSNLGAYAGEFLWTPEEGMLELAPKPMLGGTYYSFGEDMNNTGQVIGRAETTAGECHAFVWAPETGAVDLGTLGGNYSYAADINDAGQVVGRARTATGEYHAFVWEDLNGNGQSDTGEMIDLGTLGGAHSYAYAINEAGRVVGEAQTADGDWHAFLWTSLGGMRDLGTLGGRKSTARAVNDLGQVVGYTFNSASQKRAFLWEPATGMVDLGPGDSPCAEAWAINDAGQVVGWALTGSECHAFLWRPVNPQPVAAGPVKREKSHR